MPQLEDFLIEKEEEQEKISIGERLQNLAIRYLPWWPLFALLLVLGIVGGWVYLRYATPLYQIKASILIKDDKSGIDESKLLESLNIFGDKKNVENEIQVILSRTLATQVATELHLYAPIMQEGNIKDAPAFHSSPMIVEARYPDSMQAPGGDGKILFQYDSARGIVTIDKQPYKTGEWIRSPYGEIRFLDNPWYNHDPSDRQLYFTLANPEDVGLALLKNLEVTPVSKIASVINFVYTDEVPRRGKEILNTWIAAYNNAAIRDKNQLAANTLRFVDERLRYVVNELDSVEHGLERFRTKNKIIDLSAQGQLFLSNVSATDQKITEMNMQLAVLDKVEAYVLSKESRDSAIVPATLGVTDPILLQSLQSLYELESKRIMLSAVTGANNAIIKGVEDQIAAVKPGILENIRNQRHNLEAGIHNLDLSNSRYNSILQTVPQKERELLNISRQQAIKNNIFTFLLQKREETALSYSSTVADSRVIDQAIADKIPVSPKRKLVWLAAIGLAFVLGIGFVESKEIFNRNISRRDEIEKHTTVPILGEIAQESISGSSIVIGQGRRSIAAEQFRHLRTSLGYLGINARKKRILVTSSISGEGKSFICANLGISLALAGKKVVLIELDLRKPKLSEVFNMSRETGITQYFISEKKEEDIIRSVPDQHGLSIISSGPLPPNPSELIMNGRLNELLAYLDQHFDFILIDTCPVSPVTDAYIISPLCDATLYIIRQGVTPRFYLKKMDEQLKIKPLKNMAIVFNGIKAGGGRYGYGYGYGYGYTEETKSKGKKVKV